MITIIGWIRYVFGEIWLTFKDPEINDFADSLVIAFGDEYQEGNKKTYLETITTGIDPSFWNHFTTEEFNALIDDKEDISFEVHLLHYMVRDTIINHKSSEESELNNIETEIENEIETDEQIVSKQKTETFYSSIFSLI